MSSKVHLKEEDNGAGAQVVSPAWSLSLITRHGPTDYSLLNKTTKRRMYIENNERREKKKCELFVPSNKPEYFIGLGPHPLHPPDLSYMTRLTAR
jgi:hypothetical protein